MLAVSQGGPGYQQSSFVELLIMSVFYDLVTENELIDVHKMDCQGFPEDEWETIDVFRYRHSQAPELFLGAYIPAPNGFTRTLVGYICSTLSYDTIFTDASTVHVPRGCSVCIHAVCVSPHHQGRHIGLNLVREYVGRLESACRYERILLTTHKECRAFYERAGFKWAGPSRYVFGARPWFDMHKDLAVSGRRASNPRSHTGLHTTLTSSSSDPVYGCVERARPSRNKWNVRQL